MANQVFANNREISCKAADGKTIAAFPDPCFTPPPPPGVPLPYPNTAMAADTTEGSKTVKISGKEVMLKDKSYFKTSTGDEAGCAPKKGAATGTIKGKAYFTSWSMDVKFEGENVVRHQDLTTHNHASVPANTGPWPYIDAVAVPEDHKCSGDATKEKIACNEYQPHKPHGKDVCTELSNIKPRILKGETKPFVKATKSDPLSDEIAASKCLEARRCILQQYKPTKCCTPQTPHHLIEGSALFSIRAGKKGAVALDSFANGRPGTGTTAYNVNEAPCVCAEGVGHDAGGTHETMHTIQSANAMRQPEVNLKFQDNSSMLFRAWTYKQAKESATDSFRTVFDQSGCNKECLEAQMDAYHSQSGIKDETQIKAVATSEISPEKLAEAIAEADMRNSMALLNKLLNAADTAVVWVS